MNKNWRRTFAVIYAGQAFSLLGSSAVQFAVIWRLTARTESALTLTAAAVVSILPNMLLGPFAGVWIDRHNRRTIMMAADGLVAASSAALGLLFLLLGEPPVGVIYGALFLRGVGGAFHTPAMQAAMLAVWPIAPLMLVDVAGAVFAILCLLGVALPGAPPLGHAAGASGYAGEQAPHGGVPAGDVRQRAVYAPGSLFPLLAGPVSERIGVSLWFVISGLLMAAAGAACFLATRRYD